MLKNYNAIYGQSIYDICLNTYGSLDYLVKLLQESVPGQGVDEAPVTGQVYVYDDALVVDQQVNQAFNLSGIRYATLHGINGDTYYIIQQKQPRTAPRVADPAIPDDTGLPAPPNNTDDMAITVESANYTTNADTVQMNLLDMNGNSMAGGLYEVVSIELEIRPAMRADWHWDTNTGQLSLLNDAMLLEDQTIFYTYTKKTT